MLTSMKTGLDPELLTLSEGSLVPASFFLDAPNSQGYDPISYDNAAMEMRPEESNDTMLLIKRLAWLLRYGQSRMRLARRKGVIPASSTLSLQPAAPLEPCDTRLESCSRFGCSPSYIVSSGFSRRITQPFLKASCTKWRSGGFHIHQELGYTNTSQVIVGILDGILGLFDVLVNARAKWGRQSDVRRIDMGYGRAGEHRIRREAGITILEYRVLSPWPMVSPYMVGWVIDTVKTVASLPIEILLTVLEKFPKRQAIMVAINTNSVAEAILLRELCLKAWHDTVEIDYAIERPVDIIARHSYRGFTTGTEFIRDNGWYAFRDDADRNAKLMQKGGSDNHE